MLQQTLVWTAVCLAALGLCLWRPELGRVVLGIVLLVAIMPLGPWTLPNVIMAAALGVVLWRSRAASAPGPVKPAR
jgi:hypothetical protein